MMVASGAVGGGRGGGSNVMDTEVEGEERVTLWPHFPKSILVSRKPCRKPGSLSGYVCIPGHCARDRKGN